MYGLKESIPNTASGRIQVTKELYNLVAWMKVEGNALEHLQSRLKEITEKLEKKNALTTMKKAGKGAGDALVLDGYKTVNWTLSCTVREFTLFRR